MSLDSVINELDSNTEILESYVLHSEIKLYLNLNDGKFNPPIKIKTYKSSIIPGQEYSCEVSHYAHTPIQAGPYYTSHGGSTANDAISTAIFNTTTFINQAIQMGHEPEESWLVVNEDF